MKSRFLQFLSDLLLIATLPKRRLAILLTYVRLSLTKPFMRPGVRHERFLGFEVEVPDYHSFFVMFREIFVEQAYYFESTTESPFIVDCGGNIGMAALYFKYLYPKAHIVSYEPSPAFAFLEKNTSRLSDVLAVAKAVGDRDGMQTLHAPDGTAGFTGATTDEGVGRSKQFAPVGEVATVRLVSQHQERIDVLKLDIEGAETIILRDFAAIGKLSMDHIVLEFHHNPASGHHLDEVLRLLRASGYWYRVWGDRPSRFDARPSHIAIHAYQTSERERRSLSPGRH